MGTLTSLLATLLALAHVAVAILSLLRASSEAKANGIVMNPLKEAVRDMYCEGG